KTVADGYSTKWVAGDEINIFNAPKDGAFAAQSAFAIDEAGLADGTFTGTISPLEADSYSWIAVYPYAEANTDLSALALNVGGATAALATAPALAGENVPLIGAVADVAKDEAVAITMKQLASAIALTVKNENEAAYEVSEIALTFPVAVAGAFTVNASDLDAITYTAAESAVKTITFTAAEAVSIAAGESATFYAPIAPVTVASGSKLAYTINGEAGELTASGDIAFKAGKVKPVTVKAPKVVLPTDLSAEETSNCYIVYETGSYCFNATVMGIGEGGRRDGWYHTSSTLAPDSASLLWADKENVVSDVRYEGGKIYFTVNALQANAVIAAKDADGAIIWSWHIWIDTVGEITGINSNANNYWGAAPATTSVTLLDRNLGAVGTDGNLSRSFYYQYGRKDPFVFTGGVIDANLGFDAKTAAAAQTVAYSVAHPQTFIGISGDSDQAPWSSTASHHSKTWGPDSFDVYNVPAVFKTMYDPCPAGYMVFRPHDAACMFMAGSLTISDGSIVVNNGTEYKFPKEGWIYQSGAGICNDGAATYIWASCGENSGNQGYYFDGTNTNVKGPWNTTYSQAAGRPVRCQKVY
ncbi:MAG: fimbrillin family protein, partial [Bacteroidales bacterium]|nr:fimbrillin family protein [Bacteroidales bacterium]